MSKGISHLFPGTSGDIITTRTLLLDLTEHPREKSLSSKQRKAIAEKIKSRTATRSEYVKYMSDQRFSNRRKAGVREFWVQEQERILKGHRTTREWSDSQRQDILHSKRPKYNGKTIQGHHIYSANKYPHLANRGSVIFPVTFEEHLYGWHGGNFKNSLPGRPINRKTFYNFNVRKENG